MTYDELIPRLRHDATLRDDEYVRGLDLHYLGEVADGWERALLDPQPTTWAACGTCEKSYNLVRRYSFGKNEWMWVWERSCRHRSEPVVMTTEGRQS